MPIYHYEARIVNGEKITGELSGSNPYSIAEQLKNKGYIPLSITEKNQPPLVENLESLGITVSAKSRFTTQDLIVFSLQMHTLLKGGVPIMQALDGLMESADSGMTRVVSKIKQSLDEGVDLTTALKRQGKAFPLFYTNMILIGEMTGQLDTVFNLLARFYQRDKDARHNLISALRYPIIVMSTMSIAFIIINIFVLPKFSALFKSFNVDLPLPTRSLITLTEFVTQNWFMCISLPLIILIGFLAHISSPDGRLWWDQFKLSLPLVGKLMKNAALTRFARSLSITFSASVPLEKALTAIAPTVQNAYVEQQIKSMLAGVERGESITANIKRTGLFSNSVVQMISVGEETSSLNEIMPQVANFYEIELEYTIKTFTAAIEPIMTIIIAILVFNLAVGVLLPVFSMIDAIK